MRKLASEGLFREDLYFRINVIQLTVPPLRERGKDILSLTEALTSRYCEQFSRTPVKVSPEAIQAITTYTWPGNVRELENAIQRAVILCEEGRELTHDLLDIDLDLVKIDDELADNPSATAAKLAPSSNEPAEDLSLEDYFQRFVLEHQDTMSETELARKLGVSRKCLWERRQRLGIPRKKATAK